MSNKMLKVLISLALIIILQLNTGLNFVYVSAENQTLTQNPETGNTPPVDPTPTPGTVPDAQPQISSVVPDPDLITMIDGKPYVAPLGRFRMVYTIDNYEELDATQLKITEVLIGKDKIIKEQEVQFNKLQGTVKGETYNLEVNNTPYKLRYSVKYQGEEIAEGEQTVNVLNTTIKVSYNANLPDKVFKGQNITFKAEIQSQANVTLKNVIISDSKLGELGIIDSLAPGSRKTIQKIIPVDKSTNGHLVIKFDDPLGVRNKISQEFKNTAIKIDVSSETPTSSLDITASVGDLQSSQNGKVEFEINIKNTGNTSLEDVQVLDWNNKVIYTKKALKASEDITIYHDAEVEPGKTYELTVNGSVEGSTTKIQDTCTVDIKDSKAEVELDRTLSAEIVKPGELFTIHYKIVNTGNTTLEDIVISEPILGEIESFDSLEPGGELGFTKEFTIDEPAYSRTKITAVNSITKEKYEYEAAEISIPIDQPETVPDLSIVLRTEKEVLEGTDTVVFECTIENTGTQTLTNLEAFLTEGGRVLFDIPTLAPNQVETFTLEPMRVESTETFRIIIKALGEDGEELAFRSNELTVTVEDDSGSVKILRVILTVIVLLIIAIAGTLFYLIKGPFKFPPKFGRKRKIKKANV